MLFWLLLRLLVHQVLTNETVLHRISNLSFYPAVIGVGGGVLVVQVSLMSDKLTDMKKRLVSTTAEIENTVNIERTTYRALQIKKTITTKMHKIAELENQFEVQKEVCEMVRKLLDAIGAELNEAETTDEVEMWSALVHDQPQVVEIEELKTRLQIRLGREVDHLKVEESKLKLLKSQVTNLEDDIDELENELRIEEGALMKHSRNDKPFRCVSLCAANAAGNEVTGTASGGFEFFVCAEGSNVHICDYHNGELLHVFLGDNKFVGIGEKKGHVGVVTCIVHDGNLFFSGSVDESIICWDSQTLEKVRVMNGHEGSIVSLAVEAKVLASGSADATIRLWNKLTGQLHVSWCAVVH